MREVMRGQSVTVQLGPFVDYSNAVSSETSAGPVIYLSKNGSVFATRGSSFGIVHDRDGFYRVPLNSVDVGTLGHVRMEVESGAVHLPLWDDLAVVASAYWNAKYATTPFATRANVESARADLATDVGALDFATQAEVESARADLAADIGALDFATQAELESARADIAGDLAALNDVSIASVSAAAATALRNYDLDHLMNASAPAGVPRSNSVLELIMVSAAAGTFNRALHSLKAIRERGDESWAAGAGSFDSAAVSAACKQALIDMDLDHLMRTSAPAGVPHSNTVFEKIMVSAAGGTFTRTLHSLKAIRERGDASWGAAGASDWSDTEKNQIRYRLGVSGTTSVLAGTTPQLLIPSNVDQALLNYRLDQLLFANIGVTPITASSAFDLIMSKSTAGTFNRATDSLEGLKDSRITSAQVSAIAKKALTDLDLDHLLNGSAPAGVPRSNSVMELVMVSAAAGTFSRNLHSLKAIRERGDAAWTGGGTFDSSVIESARADIASRIESARADVATDVAGLNDVSIGSVSAKVAQALVNIHLDHLLDVSAPAGVPNSNSVFEKIMVSAAGGTFTRATHSLKAIRERGDAAWTGGGTFDTGAIESARADLALDISALASRATEARLSELDAGTSGKLANEVDVIKGRIATPQNLGGGASIAQNLADVFSGLGSVAAAAGGATAAQVWQYSLSAGVAGGTAGYILRSAAANAGNTVSGAVSSADISAFWNRARSANNASGSFGQAINLEYGSGDKPVNHNTGGTDSMRIINGAGAGVDDVRVRIYKKFDYDSGLITVDYIKGQSITDTNGRWKHPVYLDSGTTYTAVFTKTGVFETTTKEFTA